MEGKPVVVSACKVRMTPFRPAVPREGTQISEGALVYVTLGSSREQMLCPSQAGGGDLTHFRWITWTMRISVHRSCCFYHGGAFLDKEIRDAVPTWLCKP